METRNVFEVASRIKLRFETTQGFIGAEDLWDLPLTSRNGRANLDDIARQVNRDLKESAEESFVVKVTKKNDELQLAFDLVKHVIDIKLAEAAAESERAEKKEKKAKLLGLIAEKKDADLKGKSLEELTDMVNAL